MKFYKSYQETQQHNMLNRALSYGDGVFETILVKNYKIPFWDLHFSRLEKGLEKLKINTPIKELLYSKILTLVDTNKSYIAKITVFRDDLERGYGSSINSNCYHIVVSDFSDTVTQNELAISKTTLSKQNFLAGLKHLNRLEQVLAANELKATKYDDAIMLDDDGNVIETTNKNIVFIKNEKLYTPKLKKCGVYGVALRWLEKQGYNIMWKEIEFNSIEKYHVMMVCNSIHGFNVITSIEDKFKFNQFSQLVEEIQGKWNNTLKNL